MKQIPAIIGIVILSVFVFMVSFSSGKAKEPNSLYQVYLDDQIIGVIASKQELEDYIDEKGSEYKETYNVDKVYPPAGLSIKKVMTFSNRVDSISDVYKKIAKTKPFTIKGYQISLKGEDEPDIVYVTEEKIYRDATQKAIETFVGKETYALYNTDSQNPIETTGSFYENIYIEEEKTIKEVNISVEETIYTDVLTLSQFLLFGTDEPQKTYTVKEGDTIEKVAFNNKISIEEFFISNPEFNSESNLLYPGQKVNIGYVNPAFTVVTIRTNTEDQVNKYNTEYIDDWNMVVGDMEVVQKGSDGLKRVTTSIKSVNGNITYVDPISSEELKPTVTEVIRLGQKYVSNVGSLHNWGWPTAGGWMITSEFGYRWHPFTWQREFHDAIDISGPGHGSPIYAANNGTVITSQWHWSYGWYIVIDHNNGYFTLYAHMASLDKRVGQIVRRGDIIGTMGMTGVATGPHLHFSVYNGGVGGAYVMSPWSLYR